MKAELLLLKCIFTFSLFCTSQAGVVQRNENSNIKKKIIIDTDAGGDDAVGILLALKFAEAHKEMIEILAITCTFGNTAERNVETNVLKILTIAKRNDIPVYGGADGPLVITWEDSQYFGKDGFGDFEFSEEIKAKVDRSKHAAVALIDLVKAHPGEVTIVSLGPVTNLALAARIDPSYIQHVGEFISMGSTITGRGNIRPAVDFNFGTDPESAFIFFNSTTNPITLLSREVSLNYPVMAEWRKNVFGIIKSKTVDFLNKAESIDKRKSRFWSSSDTMSVAVALWPNLIKDYLIINVTPVYDGAAEGAVLVDYTNSTGKSANAKIVLSFDLELFKDNLLKYFKE
ncbi:probable uridine nucleosidase 2 [Belonocnema kinseyi]|uniref:probable uridine nucleosidase 2 n=1 Tax=Belonocnema kinseyi TaxID=2817044 RepID=UPI00143D0C9A|nr:probable uridine nucleosidase 2 [Belonocnema kinseyi]